METLYSQLSVSNKEIRVVRLSPVPDDNGPIHCQLSIIPLNEAHDLLPISYVWGDATQTTEIKVNGVPFQATVNLVSFLRHFRHLPQEYHQKCLWIDAICINQQDVEERGYQVGLMAEIYGQPEITISWLGLESRSEGSLLAGLWINNLSIDMWEGKGLRDISWLEKNAKELLKPIGAGPVWSAIRWLMKRPYFTRVWTLQETVLPAENIILCGSFHFRLSQLLCVYESLAYLSGKGQDVLLATLATAPREEYLTRKALTSRGHIVDAIGLKPAEMIFELKRVRQDMLDNSKQNRTFYMLQSWRTILLMRFLKSTDRRDQIYGGMALCTQPLIKIDYTKSVRQVFVEHAGLAINTFRNSDQAAIVTSALIPSGHQSAGATRRNQMDLPSWVPDWGDEKASTVLWSDQYNTNARSFLDAIPDFPPSLFASVLIDDGVLSVGGIRIFAVEDLYKRRNQSLLEFLSQIANRLSDKDGDETEKFAEILRAFTRDLNPAQGPVGDHQHDEKDLQQFACSLLLYLMVELDMYSPDYNDEACLQKTMEISTAGGTNGIFRLSSSELAAKLQKIFQGLGFYPKMAWRYMCQPINPKFALKHGEPFLSVEDFDVFGQVASKHLHDIQALDLLSRKHQDTYFRIEGGGIGVTYGEVKPGDEICVLFACNLPAILRKVENHYLHIGVSFIAGLMEGEAVKHIIGNRLFDRIIAIEIK